MKTIELNGLNLIKSNKYYKDDEKCTLECVGDYIMTFHLQGNALVFFEINIIPKKKGAPIMGTEELDDLFNIESDYTEVRIFSSTGELIKNLFKHAPLLIK